MTAATAPFRHPALFYRDADEYLAGTVEFITTGLRRGEPVAVAVPTWNLELLRDALGTQAGAVRLLDMTVEGRNPGRIIPGVLRAFADRHRTRRVRIIGEPIWAGRSALEYPACAQHEALINAAFAGREATILCPYDLTHLPPHMIADAYATHPVLIDRGAETRSAAYDPEHVVAAYNRPLPEPPAGALRLEFDAADLARVRHAAVEFAGRSGMGEPRVDDLELIVGEATANSVVHGGGGSGTLALWTEEGRLCCRISDAGHITDPLAGRLPAPARTAGGRGLLLINQLADLVRIHTGPSGTTLLVQLALD
ncbi:sensor histidine kinase [Nocardia yamanashiensis]|uniref:sensor histidine kinase n=1 Tax=Nocardia yamanashiensis TaxID=209247 RepID=UPI001E2FA76D|nr:sensor histidine kinase [Nocardia yamanashiensis]UGT45139.1 sensor histidine kinase [Nocardia yamanashiensis]